jgi:hypothetical protein
MGYDFLAIKALVARGHISGVGRQIGVGKESDIFEVRRDRQQQLLLLLLLLLPLDAGQCVVVAVARGVGQLQGQFVAELIVRAGYKGRGTGQCVAAAR